MWSISSEMNPVRRSTMEDVHVVLPAGSWDNGDMTYLAIYDGHGGRDMVDFLQQALHHNVAIELKDETVPVATRIERALLVTDIQAHKFGIRASGSTVAMCLVHHETQTLYTANVGDARVVVASQEGTTAVRLSQDHRADDPVEVNRIDQAGGFCLKGRVVGVLAVARSLGDFGFKRYVVAKPHTSIHKAMAPSLDFIILACDGLWDVLTDQQAVDLIHRSQRPKDQVAEELTEYAIQKGTTDNVTVIVFWL
jgi:serine/threonine protein phosphatase PrpC